MIALSKCERGDPTLQRSKQQTTRESNDSRMVGHNKQSIQQQQQQQQQQTASCQPPHVCMYIHTRTTFFVALANGRIPTVNKGLREITGRHAVVMLIRYGNGTGCTTTEKQ